MGYSDRMSLAADAPPRLSAAPCRHDWSRPEVRALFVKPQSVLVAAQRSQDGSAGMTADSLEIEIGDG